MKFRTKRVVLFLFAFLITLTSFSDGVTDPVAVRYAWADNPDGANLYNKEGLPASPFRTDDF